MKKASHKHSIDAHLIENVQRPSSTVFTLRGLHALELERLISRNGINGDRLAHYDAGPFA